MFWHKSPKPFKFFHYLFVFQPFTFSFCPQSCSLSFHFLLASSLLAWGKKIPFPIQKVNHLQHHLLQRIIGKHLNNWAYISDYVRIWTSINLYLKLWIDVHAKQLTCAWIDGSWLTISWDCNQFVSLDGNIFICKGSNDLQLTPTWTNIWFILDVGGLETLHNIAGCGKIKLPCPAMHLHNDKIRNVFPRCCIAKCAGPIW
jgi:hypothetical protein